MRLKTLRMPLAFVSSLLCPIASAHWKKAIRYNHPIIFTWTGDLWPWVFFWGFFKLRDVFEKSHGQRVLWDFSILCSLDTPSPHPNANWLLGCPSSPQPSDCRDTGMATPVAGASSVQAEGHPDWPRFGAVIARDMVGANPSSVHPWSLAKKPASCVWPSSWTLTGTHRQTRHPAGHHAPM